MNQSEMNELKSIKSNLIHEFIEVSKKEGQLQNMDTLMHTIKNLCKVIKDAEEEEGMMQYSGGYSYAMPYMNGQYAYGMDYSGARGRGSYANRDSMGRYSSHGDMMSYLHKALESASNDMERANIQNMINSMP